MKPAPASARTASWLEYSFAVEPVVRYLNAPVVVPLVSCWEIRKSIGVFFVPGCREFRALRFDAAGIKALHRPGIGVGVSAEFR